MKLSTTGGALILAVWVGSCAPLDKVPPPSTPTRGEDAVEPSGGFASEDASLASKINANTPPRSAVSLRLTEEGKRLLDSGRYSQAVTRMEQALAIDSTNPYVYYFLAKAHFYLTHYRQSVEFLEVAESFLIGEYYWLGQVHSLKGRNYQALGLLDRARRNYTMALRFNPENREAALGLSGIRNEMTAPAVR